MKKLSGFISALALLIGMTACQNEVQPVEPSEDTVTATIGVSVPGALKTKAFGEASDLTEVNYEIWNEDFSEIVQKDVISLDAELKGTLELKLIRFKTYNVLFWAQGASAKHTWTNLKEINIDYSTNVENDAFAGRVLNINATNDMNLAHNVALVRPFAQVNFATDDLGAKGVTQGDLTLKSAKVTVPGLATTYDLINGVGLTPKEVVFTSETVMPEPFVMNEVNYDHIMVFYPLVADGEATIVNLKAEFEVNCGSEVLPISWTGKGAMNNVPVQADYRTNFYGSLFTNSGNIDVKIDKDFTEIVEPNLNIDTKTIADLASAPEGTYLLEGTVTNAEPVSEGFEKVTITDASASSITLTLSTTQADLAVKAAATHYQVGDVIKVIVEKTADAVAPLEVLNHSRDVEDIYLEVAAGNNVTLTENVVINHGPIVVAEGQEVVIDLGAYTISNGKELYSEESKKWSLISVQGGKLTLKGTEGGLKAIENDCYAVDVRNGGELVIEGGNYVGNISAVYVYEGTATIKGGNFSVLQKAPIGEGYEMVINCYDANYAAGKASAVISGGVFQKFNPAAANDAALLAEGYIATYDETAGTYTVAEKPALPALATGDYWIVYDGKYMYPGNESANYYYGNLEENGYKDNVFTITAVEGGYTIQDSYGRYLYQSGTYTSFNVNASMPETGAVWTIATNEDNTYSVKNGDYNVVYDTSHSNIFMSTSVEPCALTMADASAATERPAETITAVIADGDYWFMASGKAGVPVPGSKTYGNITITDAVDGASTAANAFTFTFVEGKGYTIKDSNDKYYYQAGTYNNFNTSATVTDACYWKIEKVTETSYKITNLSVDKYIQYVPGNNNFGSFATDQTSSVLPDLVKADNPIVEEIVEVNPKYVSNISWVKGANSYDDTATLEGALVDPILKLGKSNYGGEATLTIPAGTKKIAFYSVAWKAKSPTITFKSGETVLYTCTPAAQENASNTGPYSLELTDADYHVFDFATDAEVTITVNSGDTATKNKGERALIIGLKALTE